MNTPVDLSPLLEAFFTQQSAAQVCRETLEVPAV